MSTTNISDEKLHDFTSTGWTLVEAGAPWCPPCKALEPILEKVSEEHKNNLKIGKINVDDNPIVSETYNIQSIPTLLLFKDGKLENASVGGRSEKGLLQFLEQSGVDLN